MSIKDTLEQIEATPDNDETGIPTAWFALDDRRITTADFKSLAAYTRKLEAAVNAIDEKCGVITLSTECTGTECPGCNAGRMRAIAREALKEGEL